MSDLIDATNHVPSTFSLDKFLAGIEYPIEKITVFTDARSVNELNKLIAKRAELEAKQIELSQAARKPKGPRTISTAEQIDAPESNALDIVVAELEVLQSAIDDFDRRVAESALIFELQGMPPEVIENITIKHYGVNLEHKDFSGTPEEEARDDEMISRSIISVTNHFGDRATDTIDAAYIKKLRGALVENEYLHLVQGVARVNLDAALFDHSTDASFLSGRADLAG